MVFMFRFITIIIITLCFQNVSAQDLLSNKELESLLEKAELQSQKYKQVFIDLSTEEIKTKLYFKKDGTLDDKRIIKSNFIVYQTPDSKRVQEFRNVFEYNGKNTRRSNKKIGKLFEKLLKTDNPQKEYVLIKKEGTRFDGKVTEWGLTLGQIRPFINNLRNYFNFEVIAQELINKRKVWKITYEQINPIPQITLNRTEEEKKIQQQQKYRGYWFNTFYSDDLRPSNALMKGTLWLDKETAQIWRNEFEIVANPSVLSTQVTAVKVSFTYQLSDFDVLVPKKFTYTYFTVEGKNDDTLRVFKSAESIYEYSQFKEFKTEVKDFKQNTTGFDNLK